MHCCKQCTKTVTYTARTGGKPQPHRRVVGVDELREVVAVRTGHELLVAPEQLLHRLAHGLVAALQLDLSVSCCNCSASLQEVRLRAYRRFPECLGTSRVVKYSVQRCRWSLCTPAVCKIVSNHCLCALSDNTPAGDPVVDAVAPTSCV